MTKQHYYKWKLLIGAGLATSRVHYSSWNYESKYGRTFTFYKYNREDKSEVFDRDTILDLLALHMPSRSIYLCDDFKISPVGRTTVQLTIGAVFDAYASYQVELRSAYDITFHIAYFFINIEHSLAEASGRPLAKSEYGFVGEFLFQTFIDYNEDRLIDAFRDGLEASNLITF